jgi:hypothetical protein
MVTPRDYKVSCWHEQSSQAVYTDQYVNKARSSTDARIQADKANLQLLENLPVGTVVRYMVTPIATEGD